MNQNQHREYLFQQDLEHEKQMDRIIKDAQPKKINEDYKIKLMKPPIITRDLIGPEYMAERQLLDLSLDLQMQNTIKQAMYALDGKTPEPMKGSVTEEMIGTARNANDADSLVIATYDAESRAASAAYLKSKNKG
jgi:hypothetical protein